MVKINKKLKFSDIPLKRMPIPIDESVIIQLRGLLEARLQRRLSVAEIARMAFQQLLDTEGELSE